MAKRKKPKRKKAPREQAPALPRLEDDPDPAVQEAVLDAKVAQLKAHGLLDRRRTPEGRLSICFEQDAEEALRVFRWLRESWQPITGRAKGGQAAADLKAGTREALRDLERDAGSLKAKREHSEAVLQQYVKASYEGTDPGSTEKEHRDRGHFFSEIADAISSRLLKTTASCTWHPDIASLNQVHLHAATLPELTEYAYHWFTGRSPRALSQNVPLWQLLREYTAAETDWTPHVGQVVRQLLAEGRIRELSAEEYYRHPGQVPGETRETYRPHYQLTTDGLHQWCAEFEREPTAAELAAVLRPGELACLQDAPPTPVRWTEREAEALLHPHGAPGEARQEECPAAPVPETRRRTRTQIRLLAAAADGKWHSRRALAKDARCHEATLDAFRKQEPDLFDEDSDPHDGRGILLRLKNPPNAPGGRAYAQ